MDSVGDIFSGVSVMTCKDCAYFNSTEHLKPEWIGSNRCDKHTADGYQEYVGEDSEVCEDFVSKDGTYHNGTDHCPKCGKPVPQCGLCDECNSWESIIK